MTTAARTELIELFSFLTHEREDVRKMAASGLSQMSSDNAELNAFLAHDEKNIKILMDMLTVKAHQTLGDILTVFINCAADASVADAFASAKVVQRVMRLLDGLEASDLSPNVLPAFKEMSLMLLNNLTASTVVAIQDLLQVEDEELAGFFVGRLHSLYSRQPDPSNDEENENESTSAKKKDDDDDDDDEDSKKNKKSEAADKRKKSAATRDLRKWFLQVCLNITRTPDGQRYLLSEDWPETLVEILSESPNPMLRFIVARTFKNCASVPENHKALASCGVVTVIVERLHKCLEPDVTQLAMAEFVASMLASEEGMGALEEINTKKYLVELCGVSSTTAALVGQGSHGASSGKVVEELDDEATEESEKKRAEKEKAAEEAKKRGNQKLAAEVKSFIESSILPYMDDIQDAYVMDEEGGDE